MNRDIRLIAGLLLGGLASPACAHPPAPDGQAVQSESPNGAPVAGERAIDIPLDDGSRQRVLYASPPRPRGTIIMLPGGAGDLGIERDGDIRRGHNFVVRTRGLWAARGYAALIPDALDHENLRGLRSSPSYAAVVAAIVAFARSQAPGPVFLLGTSQGSIAAMYAAAHMGPGQIAGLVLTESVSRLGGSRETVFSADPQDVRAPALVVANRDDRCPIAPAEDAAKIAQAMSKSPQVQVLYVSGGVDRSGRPCGSLTPHGYYGIEPGVVAEIADWMDKHP